MSTQNYASGMGVGTLLQLAFIFCKVAEVTAIQYWSWWWVMSPTLIGAGLVVLVLVITLIAYACVEKFKK